MYNYRILHIYVFMYFVGMIDIVAPAAGFNTKHEDNGLRPGSIGRITECLTMRSGLGGYRAAQGRQRRPARRRHIRITGRAELRHKAVES